MIQPSASVPSASEPRSIDPVTGKRRAGRPSGITREAIAQAALATIDGITVGRVAKQLGVGVSSLYHHVDGRGELILLAADAALAEVVWPAGSDDWRSDLTALADLLVGELLARPGLARALQSLSYPPPRLARALQETADRLLALGVSERDAGLALSVLGRLAMDAALAGDVEPLPDRVRTVEYRYVLTAGDPIGDMHDKIDVFLDGFALRVGVVG